MRRIEQRLGIDIEAYLREHYVGNGLTQEQIATSLGVDASTVTRWMAFFGIETRLFASDRSIQ